MKSRLYPDKGGPSDPLRLASEFASVYGTSAIEDLIRQQVDDSAWEPGKLHSELLELPWSDVLTTNWDTLLERSARRLLVRRYGVIQTVADMASATGPRIVKLHGSLPSILPFVLTEEDYRRYPTSHAAFVNLARQVFIENELVLIGFSGDDPNFLQWAGWVRDQLRDHARRLYLVGVFDIPNPRRKLLEQMNISVVDLAPCVTAKDADERHANGLAMLLKFLRDGSPPHPTDWPFKAPTGGLEAADESDILAILDESKRHRESYPGWLICPGHTRNLLNNKLHRIDDLIHSKSESHSEEIVSNAVHEMAWLSLTAMQPLPKRSIDTASQELTKPIAEHRTAGAIAEIALAVALSTQHEVESAARHDVALDYLAIHGGDLAPWVPFLRALRARNNLDLAELEVQLAQIHGGDPIWLIRQASLAVELGRGAEMENKIRTAVIQLRDRQLRDPKSIWVATRLAWAEFFGSLASMTRLGKTEDDDPLAQKVDPRTLAARREIDPWTEIEYLRYVRRSEEEFRGSRMRAARFDAGIYRESTSGRGPGIQKWPVAVRSFLDFFGSTGGLLSASFFSGEARAAALAGDLSGDPRICDWVLALCRSRADAQLVDQIFSRKNVALMDIRKVEEILGQARRLCVFAFAKYDLISDSNQHFAEQSHWIERINAAFEVLSRLGMRLEGASAGEAHRLALSWSKQKAVHHWWTHEAYGRLLQRTWLAVPGSSRPSFGIEHLKFSLGCEIPDNAMHHWPDPVDARVRYVGIESDEGSARLANLIEFARSSDPARGDALLRLLSLQAAGLLTAEQNARLGQAIWSRTQGGLPELGRIYDFVVFDVPSPDGVDAQAAYASKYFQANVRFAEGWLADVAQGCERTKEAGGVGPESAVAEAWADKAIAWRPRRGDDFDFPPSVHPSDIALFLRKAVFPFASITYFGEVVLDRISAMFCEVPETVASGYALAQVSDPCAELALLSVRKALWSTSRRSSIAGAQAALYWIEDDGPARFTKWLPLIDELVSIASVPRHPASAIVWKSLAALADTASLPSTTVDRLVFALGLLQEPSAYEAWADSDPEWQEEAALLIGDAIRVCIALKKTGRSGDVIEAWLDRGRTDPSPEVRAAMM